MIYFLSFIGGVLSGISFSPILFRFFIIIGFLLLFYTAEKSKKVFLTGFIFGLGYFISHFWWLTQLVLPVDRLLLYSGLVLMYAYLALYFAILYLFVKKSIWTAPFGLVYLEWVRSIGPLGFPWGYAGYSLTPFPLLTQLASIGGIYLLTFILVLFSLYIYVLLKYRKIKYLLYLFILSFVVIGYGLLRILPPERGRIVKVGIVQPNISPLEKGTSSERKVQFENLVRLIKKAAEKGSRFIVIPETATIYTFDNAQVLSTFVKLAEQYDIVIAGGTPLFEKENNRWVFYNAAFSLDKYGIEKYYKKNKLVPFSERFPFSDYFPILEKIDVGGGNFGRGREFTVFHNAGFNFAILICYESIFPFYAAGFKNIDLIVNVTNDGWFYKTWGPYQHAEMSIIRTIERGRPLVRSANNGISMYVDTRGRVIQKTHLFTEEILNVDVKLSKRFNIFPYGGYLTLLFSFVGLLYFLLRKKSVSIRD